jgi:hypothetical protein
VFRFETRLNSWSKVAIKRRPISERQWNGNFLTYEKCESNRSFDEGAFKKWLTTKGSNQLLLDEQPTKKRSGCGSGA